MKKKFTPVWYVLGLLVIAILSIAVDLTGMLQTQILRAPQQLEDIKLVRQNTNPLQFDIYYQDLRSERPASVSVTMVKALLDQGGRFQERFAVIDSVVLSTGNQEVITTSSSQTLVVRDITPQNTTKLGTIITNLPQQEYVALEYDVTISGRRTTLIDNPLPLDFPIGYTPFQNPTGEPMYISVPGYHTVLAPLEKVYLPYPQVNLGAVLLADTMTTLQPLSDLSQSSLISQSLALPLHQLHVDQNQLVIPELPAKDVNTLIIRYRNEVSDWSYQSFLLPASTDLTLPVEVQDLTDIYNQVEYSFAMLSNAMPTVNLEFPYNSLIPQDQFSVFYRTPYISLIPELLENEAGLPIDLSITTAEVPNGLYLGLLTRDALTSLPEALHYFEQKLPVALFDTGSATFSTVMSNPQQLPYFNVIGRNDQVWSKQTKRPDLEFISNSFEAIALQPDDEQIPELEIVNETQGDKLLCFVKTDQGSFSLPTIGSEVLMSSNCLASARRAGFTEGRLYPVVYRAKSQTLEALKHYLFDDRISTDVPEIVQYDPLGETLSLSAGFEDVDMRIISSTKPDFSSFSSQTLENIGKSNFAVPLLPGCNALCYLKVVAIAHQDTNVLLGFPSETVLFSPTPEPLLQLCFTNAYQVKKLYDPQELKFQVLTSDGEPPIDLVFRSDTQCYELGAGELADREEIEETTTSSTSTSASTGANGSSNTSSNTSASGVNVTSSSSTPSDTSNTASGSTGTPSPSTPDTSSTSSDSSTSDTSTGTTPDSDASSTGDAPDSSTTPATTTFIPRANAQEDSETPFTGQSLRDLISVSTELPSETIVIHTNGLSNSHIDIPPQRHYVTLANGSEQQLLYTPLVFEHAYLNSSEQPRRERQLQTSYQLSQWGEKSTFFSSNQGNIILHRLGDTPYFLDTFAAPAPINETLLFPSDGHVLEIPHTIRLVPSEQIILLGYSEGNNRAEVTLEIPERSQVQLFLDNIFRPNIEQQLPLSGGITYNTESGFMKLENPTGQLTIPVSLSFNQATDTALYDSTVPPTKVPSEVNVAFLESQQVFHVEQPQDIPRSTLREPLALSRAGLGLQYNEKISLFGIENSRAFEIIDHRFFTTTCQETFSFDPLTREITGQVPNSSQLEGCFLQVLVRYLIRNEFAEMEITTPLTYEIPILKTAPGEELTVDVVRIPIIAGSTEVNESIQILKALEELVETTPQFVSKNNTESLISSIGELLIVFDVANQQFVISGDSTGLIEPTSRYLRAIEQETGKLVLFELQLIPVNQEEIIIPVTQSFPNRIDVPQILRDEGFSDEEIATLTVETDSLPTQVTVSDENVVTIFALPELNDQVFFALLEKASVTPSAFEEFEKRLTDQPEENKPETLRIDLRLQVNEPRSVTTEPLQLNPDKFVSIDLKRFAPNSNTLVTGQLPEFFTRSGNQISGRTPVEPQELNLLIQDYTHVVNIVVPLAIGATTSQEELDTETPTEEEITPESDEATANRRAGENREDCFPDIALQPLAYREAICLANDFNIISGSGGLFRPDNQINRAEVSKVLVTGPLAIQGLIKASEIDNINNGFTQQSFFDVPKTAWFYGFVETVLGFDIFSGYPDGSFQPGTNMNRAEAAKVIVNTLLEVNPSAFSSAESIAANTRSGDPWYAPYVRIMNLNGGDFPDPSDGAALSAPISRAQFVYNLVILLDQKADQLSIIP